MKVEETYIEDILVILLKVGKVTDHISMAFTPDICQKSKSSFYSDGQQDGNVHGDSKKLENIL